MSIEERVNYQLNKFPAVKKVVKRVYQVGMYTISPKIKSEGNIECVSPNDGKEYFFGYYDKSPWDATGRYMLCMRALNTWSDVSPKQPAQIILIDTEKGNKCKKLAVTHSWNVQQSCMLQWLGPDYSSRILYNDFRDGKYVSVILSIKTGEEKVIPFPVYSVAADGSFALSLDFSRLYRLRPGYGYYNVPESTANEKLPDKPCIWKVDLESGEVTHVLKYTDFANFEPRPEMNGAEHKVNHIMLSPNGKRFMVLYRWFQGQRKYTRLVTCNVDGTDMYNLSDDDMVSHCYWKNDSEILAFENKKGTGSGYYLMKDKSKEYEQFWKGIDYDGHPSYSPDGSRIVFDRYPDRARVASVMVSDAENRDKDKVRTVARVFAPFKYDNDTRCDLHPRWSRDGKKICFDSVFEGHRGLYVVEVEAKHQQKISVAMCTYNGEKYIKEQLDSILMQTKKPDEIIICDDASKDNTLNIIYEYKKKYRDTEFIIVRNSTNVGYIQNFLNAVRKASGDIIFLADQDDIWYSTKVENVIEQFYTNEKVLAINHAYDLIDEKGYKIKNRLSVHQNEDGILRKIEWKKFIVSTRFPGMSMAIRKELLSLLPDISTEFIPAHDWFLNEVASYADGMYYLGKKLAGYRQHENNSVGAIKGDNGKQLFENRMEVLSFFSKTHKAMMIMHSDDKSIMDWASVLQNLDKNRINAIKKKSVVYALSIYLTNYKNMTKRCIAGDIYTILRLKLEKRNII